MNFLVYNWTPILIPFIVGLYRFSKFNKALKLLFVFVCYGTANEVVGLIWRNVLDAKNTMPSKHLYLMVSFLLMALFYIKILRSIISRRTGIGIILLFEIYCILNLIFVQTIWQYPAMPNTIGKLVLITFSILLFYKIMLDAEIKSLWKEPLVFINIAVLIYYSGNLFFSLLFQYILEYSREFSKLTVVYFSLLNALFYILIAIGFWKAGKQNKLKPEL